MARPRVGDFVPPLALRLVRQLRRPRLRFFGVYDSPEEIPGPRPWDRETYVQAAATRLRLARASARPDPDLLPTITLAGILTNEGPCRVLDFAGGPGIVYYAIERFLAKPQHLLWSVVDNPRLLEIGRSNREGGHQVEFLEELPDPKVPYDVVHINTSLQYMDSPYALLDRLLLHRPRWLLLTRLLAGDTREFLTAQEVDGKLVPCRFLRISELSDWLRERGFELAFRTPVVEGAFEELYDKTVPGELRVPFAIHALFQKIDRTHPASRAVLGGRTAEVR